MMGAANSVWLPRPPLPVIQAGTSPLVYGWAPEDIKAAINALVPSVPGYFVNPLTTVGDVIYCSVAGTPGTPARLGAGAAGTVLTSNGVGAAPSWTAGGSFTNPMTTTGDIIYGTNTATPSTPGRLGIGSPITRLAVTPDGVLGYAPGGGLVPPSARGSYWYTTLTNAPTTIGDISWSRVATSVSTAGQCKQNGSVYQTNSSAALVGSHATIGATLVTGNYWLPSYAAVYMASHTIATTSTVGLYLSTTLAIASNAFFNAPPAAVAASVNQQGYGIMWSSSDGLTGTFKFIAATTTEFDVIDTGVQWTTDGITIREFALIIWQGPTDVYGEIYSMSGSAPVRLWGGSLPIVSFNATTQIVAWSLTKTLAASTAVIVHGFGQAGYMTGVEAA